MHHSLRVCDAHRCELCAGVNGASVIGARVPELGVQDTFTLHTCSRAAQVCCAYRAIAVGTELGALGGRDADIREEVLYKLKQLRGAGCVTKREKIRITKKKETQNLRWFRQI